MNEHELYDNETIPTSDAEKVPDSSTDAIEKTVSPTSEAPQSDTAPEEQPTSSHENASEDGSYHLTKEQLPPADAPISVGGNIPGVAAFSAANQSASTPHTSPTASMPPHTEYEYSYDSASGRYTYTDSQLNSTKQKQKNRVPLILCGTALILILSTLMGVLGGAIAAGARANGATTTQNHNVPVMQQTVMNVNNAEIGETSLMQAASTAVNSVVVIDTFLSQAAADAGEVSGSGSGVIWTADGYIVTCNHVIDGYTLIRVTLADGTTYFADIVGTDAKTDLAVLKIAASELPAVTVRGTDLVLAETVIAIGNPLGVLSNTVSSGILSCLTREITIEGQTMSLIQIDAAVNHGNSGGGLFDVNGSLIGIVNAKSTGESVEGIGFAIPISTVMDVCNQLIEKGYVEGRPQLGISVVTVTQSNSSYIFSSEYYPDLQEYATTTYRDVWGREHTQIIPGAYIYDTSAVAGYEAGSEHLEFGDRILYVGSSEVSDISGVKAALSDYNAGDTIQVTVQRDQSKTIIVNIILGQQGASN